MRNSFRAHRQTGMRRKHRLHTRQTLYIRHYTTDTSVVVRGATSSQASPVLQLPPFYSHSPLSLPVPFSPFSFSSTRLLSPFHPFLVPPSPFSSSSFLIPSPPSPRSPTSQAGACELFADLLQAYYNNSAATNTNTVSPQHSTSMQKLCKAIFAVSAGSSQNIDYFRSRHIGTLLKGVVQSGAWSEDARREANEVLRYIPA